eukprot:PhM_4_TR2002/c0_g1_i1/m.87832
MLPNTTTGRKNGTSTTVIAISMTFVIFIILSVVGVVAAEDPHSGGAVTWLGPKSALRIPGASYLSNLKDNTVLSLSLRLKLPPSSPTTTSAVALLSMEPISGPGVWVQWSYQQQRLEVAFGRVGLVRRTFNGAGTCDLDDMRWHTVVFVLSRPKTTTTSTSSLTVWCDGVIDITADPDASDVPELGKADLPYVVIGARPIFNGNTDPMAMVGGSVCEISYWSGAVLPDEAVVRLQADYPFAESARAALGGSEFIGPFNFLSASTSTLPSASMEGLSFHAIEDPRTPVASASLPYSPAELLQTQVWSLPGAVASGSYIITVVFAAALSETTGDKVSIIRQTGKSIETIVAEATAGTQLSFVLCSDRYQDTTYTFNMRIKLDGKAALSDTVRVSALSIPVLELAPINVQKGVSTRVHVYLPRIQGLTAILVPNSKALIDDAAQRGEISIAEACASAAPGSKFATSTSTSGSATVFTIPAQFTESTAGEYRVCLQPGPTALQQVNGGTMVAPTVITVSGSDSAAQPLPPNKWVTHMLHYGRTLSDHIDDDNTAVDFFADIGGESGMQPATGDHLPTVDPRTSKLVWTPAYDVTGMWSQNTQDTSSHFTDFYALAVYSPKEQIVTPSFRVDDDATVWVDSTLVFRRVGWDNKEAIVGDPITLTQGWHQFIFKLREVTGYNWLAVKFDAEDLKWRFELPEAVRKNKQICGKQRTTVTSRPCPAGGEALPETACHQSACCYDYARKRCLAAVDPVKMVRDDGRCGAGYPSPWSPQHVGQCDGFSSGALTCCATTNTCVQPTNDMCTCPGCLDYSNDGTTVRQYREVCSWCTCGIERATEQKAVSYEMCIAMCDQMVPCQGVRWDAPSKACTLLMGDCASYETSSSPGAVFRAGKQCASVPLCNDCGVSKCLTKSSELTANVGMCEEMCRVSHGCRAFSMDTTSKSCALHYEDESSRTCGEKTPYLTSHGTRTVHWMRCDGEALPAVDTTVKPEPVPKKHDLFEYIGCYSDSQQEQRTMGDMTDASTVLLLQDSMTPTKCFEFCWKEHGTLFFGLQAGYYCYCGLQYAQIGVSTECNVRCSGDDSIACGGKAQNSVYEVKTTSNGCPNDRFVYFDGFCYEPHFDKEITYTQAVFVCNTGSTDPATAIMTSVLSQKENNFLGSLMTKASGGRATTMWLGGSDMNKEGEWGWIDGQAWRFEAWRNKGTNNVYHEIEDCLEYSLDKQGANRKTWTECKCTSLSFAGVICKKQPSTAAWTPKTTSVELGSEAVCLKDTVGVSSPHWRDLQRWLQFEDDSDIHDVSIHNQTFPVPSALQPGIEKVFSGVSGNALRVKTNKMSVAGIPLGTWSLSSSIFTITSWVWVTPYVRTAIVSRAGKNTRQGLTLSVNAAQLEARLGMTIVRVPLAVEVYVHVAVVYDGDTLFIYVDGVQKQSLKIPVDDGTLTPGDQPLIFLSNSWGTPSDTLLLDDVRIYNSVLTADEVRETRICRQNGPSQLWAYRGTTPALKLRGENLREGVQAQLRVGECTSTQASPQEGAFTPVSLTDISTTMDVAYVKLTPSHTSLVNRDLKLCLNSGEKTPFDIDTGVVFSTVELTAITPTVYTKPITMKPTGTSLVDGMWLAFSPSPECTHGLEAFVLHNNEISVTLKHVSPVLHVCWKSSAAAAAVPTGLTVSCTTDWVHLVSSTASSVFTSATATEGISPMIGRRRCSEYDSLGPHFVLRVVMGDFVDYYLPTDKETTLCALLTGETSAAYAWSPDDPVSNDTTTERATHIRRIGPPVADNILGSGDGWPDDGRHFLSAIGSRKSGHTGGCCASHHSDVHMGPRWGQAYEVYIHALDANYRRLYVSDVPLYYYKDTPVAFHVTFQNSFFADVDPPATTGCTLMLQNSDGVVLAQSAASKITRMIFTPTGDDAMVGLQVVVTHPTVKTKMIAPFLFPRLVAVPSPALSSSSSATSTAAKILSGGTVNVTLRLMTEDRAHPTVACAADCSATDLLSTEPGGEAAVRPDFGDKVTVFGQSAKYVWHELATSSVDTTTTGYVDCVTYYTFALYTPKDQREVVLFADNDVRVFVDSMEQLHKQDVEGTRFLLSSVAQGWHQVVVRQHCAQKTPASTMRAPAVQTIRLYGAALIVDTEMPTNLPPDATPLPSNVWITQLLHLGQNIDDAFQGAPSEDYLSGEASTRPRIGDVVRSLTWTPLQSPDGWWAMSTGDNFVQYFALAVYTPDARSIPMSFRYDDHLTVWVDGVVAARYTYADGGRPQTARVFLSQGWHQFLFKIAEETEANYFRVMFGSEAEPVDTLSWQFEVPSEGHNAFVTRGGWLTRLLHLGALSTDRIVTDDVPLHDVASAATLLMKGAKYRGLTWTPLTTSNGVWASEAVGGGFTQFYSIGVKNKTPQRISLSLRHERELVVFLDGQEVYNATVGSGVVDEHTVPFELSKGYHQFVFRLHAPPDITWSTTNTAAADADKSCANEDRVVCTAATYCVLGQPTPHAETAKKQHTSSVIVAGGNTLDLATCQQKQPTGASPLSSSSIVGCCDRTGPHFSVSLRGANVEYAYSLEDISISAPYQKQLQWHDGATVVTLACDTEDTIIMYTIDGSDPRHAQTAVVYRTPFTVVKLFDDQVSVVVRAVALLGQLSSDVAAFTVPVELYPRSAQIVSAANAPVLIDLDDIVGSEVSSIHTVFALPTSQHRATIVASEVLGHTANATFSGALRPQRGTNYVVLPAMGAGLYSLYSFTSLSLEAGMAAVSLGEVALQSLKVQSKHVVLHEMTLVPINAGASRHDALQWFQTKAGTETCDDTFCRLRLPSSYVRLESFQRYSVVAEVAGSRPGVLDCLCYASNGGRHPDGIKSVAVSTTQFPVTVVNTDGGVDPTVLRPRTITVAQVELVDNVGTYGLKGQQLHVTGVGFEPTVPSANVVEFVRYQYPELMVQGTEPICRIDATKTTATRIVCTVHTQVETVGLWDIRVRIGSDSVSNLFRVGLAVAPPTPFLSKVVGYAPLGRGRATVFVDGGNFNVHGAGMHVIMSANKTLLQKYLHAFSTTLTPPVGVFDAVATQSVSKTGDLMGALMSTFWFSPVVNISDPANTTGAVLPEPRTYHVSLCIEYAGRAYAIFSTPITAQFKPSDETNSAASHTTPGRGSNKREDAGGSVSIGIATGIGIVMVLCVALGVLWLSLRKRFNVVVYRRDGDDGNSIQLVTPSNIDMGPGPSAIDTDAN